MYFAVPGLFENSGHQKLRISVKWLGPQNQSSLPPWRSSKQPALDGLELGDWTTQPLEAPYNLNHSVIL